MLQCERNSQIQAYQGTCTCSSLLFLFLGSYIILQNACHTACRPVLLCVKKCFCRHTVCTSTTVPIVPRSSLAQIRRNKKFILSVLWSLVGRCAQQPKRLVAFVSQPYASLRISHYWAKLVLSHAKSPEYTFRHSFFECPALNPQATAEHETGNPSPYFPQLLPP